MDESEQLDFQQLEWAVQAIAQAAEVQVSLYPDFVCVADELALEFDEHYRRARSSKEFESLDLEQKDALEAIDCKLAKMSSLEQSELWTADALRESDEWAELRAVARDALSKMRWAFIPPPRERAIYARHDA